MNWIYDERTEHSRLMVGYNRYGITLRQWSDDSVIDCTGDNNFHYDEAFFNWKQYRNRDRCYSGDNGRGRMKDRLVSAGISLLAYYGPNTCGDVPSLSHYINGGHRFTC